MDAVNAFWGFVFQRLMESFLIVKLEIPVLASSVEFLVTQLQNKDNFKLVCLFSTKFSGERQGG